MLTRRTFIRAGTAGLLGAAVGSWPQTGRAAPVTLTARLRPRPLPGCSAPSPLWTYADEWPLVLRVPRGKPFAVALENRLAEHTTIHWHGLRIPLAMDGVPYISQPPVQPGETFLYDFTPPDPGTFFFHPHCNTVEALGRGLAGVLVVEDERERDLFEVDRVLALKDWRVNPDGSFQNFMTDAGAGKAGTFGDLRTVNGAEPPTIVVPPKARVRLRLLNIDVTRIAMLAVRGASAAVIATDGNACEPFDVKGWWLGPAARADVALVAPAAAGAEVIVEDVWPQTSRLLARIVTGAGPAGQGGSLADLRLPEAELPEPDMASAVPLDFALLAGIADPKLEAWAAASGMGLDSLCLSQRIFWSINRQAWPGLTHEDLPPPLFELKAGRTYVAEMFNGTPHRHPMHLHGHTFRVLGSNERKLPPHWCDTVLVTPKERVRIAFVAGLPGDWMFHCHIVEHQETGMMGYLRVT